MANETGDSVKDRFAQRFDGEKEEKVENEQQEKKAEKEKKAKSSKNKKTVNIKSEWTNHSIYLNDELASSLSHNYKRLDLDLDQDYGLSIKKTRHYYPLIVKLGLERLEELEGEEVKERIEELEGEEVKERIEELEGEEVKERIEELEGEEVKERIEELEAK